LDVGRWAYDSRYMRGALKAFKKAAAFGSHKAEKFLGVLHEHGEAVEASSGDVFSALPKRLV
jgi:TPR repeat protein